MVESARSIAFALEEDGNVDRGEQCPHPLIENKYTRRCAGIKMMVSASYAPPKKN